MLMSLHDTLQVDHFPMSLLRCVKGRGSPLGRNKNKLDQAVLKQAMGVTAIREKKDTASRIGFI